MYIYISEKYLLDYLYAIFVDSFLFRSRIIKDTLIQT